MKEWRWMRLAPLRIIRAHAIRTKLQLALSLDKDSSQSLLDTRMRASYAWIYIHVFDVDWSIEDLGGLDVVAVCRSRY